jgi:hypothetical protein
MSLILLLPVLLMCWDDFVIAAALTADIAATSSLLLLLLLLCQVGLDGFYSTSRANRCVVCGQEQHYLRYRVVPACYRCGTSLRNWLFLCLL